MRMIAEGELEVEDPRERRLREIALKQTKLPLLAFPALPRKQSSELSNLGTSRADGAT